MMTRATTWMLAIATTAATVAGCTTSTTSTISTPSPTPTGSSPAPSPTTSAPPGTSSPAPRAGHYAAPLPSPVLLVQGVSSANPAHTFRTQAWDFAMMRETFNTVAIEPGDQRTVARARAARLAVILEFDYKKDFFAGKDISAKIRRIVDQVRSNPGTVSGIQVADRLNQDYTPSQGLRYLAATGGVFHRELPGVPVVVSVADRNLTCGLPGQSSCRNTDPRYQYQTTATLDAFRASGYLDGFTLADNLKNEDAAIQVRAWQTARARWPSPFILLSNASQLSFPASLAPAGQQATALVAAYMTAPVHGGADGVALWAWHQLYDGSVYTFLDKDGSANTLWHEMAAASATLGLTGDRRG
jgi:hypothetical protein